MLMKNINGIWFIHWIHFWWFIRVDHLDDQCKPALLDDVDDVLQWTKYLTPWSRVVKKFPAFYGTSRFIATFTTDCHLSLSWARSIQSNTAFHFLKIYFNIILQYTPVSSKRPLSFRFPHQNPVCTSRASHTCNMPCPSLLDFITRIMVSEGRSTKTSGHSPLVKPGPDRCKRQIGKAET